VSLPGGAAARIPPIRQTILTEPIRHERGVVKVPDGPGLGVEIDRAALARFKVN